MSVIFSNLCEESLLSGQFVDRLLRLLDDLLLENNLESGEAGLIITTDSEIAALNSKYRGFDKPTDVLSFSYIEPESSAAGLEAEEAVGDIYISIQQAGQQAKEAGHSLEREVAFLAVHGMLHLLGYEHYDARSEKIMRDKEKELLKNLE